ncbi:small integral membrane protein 22 isoform X2 [Centropristis striata]|uniref:small integral membrane protein 22 isoform X2 n=1 Tax=Centropristis striata TaxID=184440 RepID=UPI0027E00231|nr:small integral membrane protein 22 isoform X2 [Centropristis striata]
MMQTNRVRYQRAPCCMLHASCFMFHVSCCMLPVSFLRVMEQREVQQQIQDQVSQVFSRLNFFQSDWDVAFFAVFFIFIVSKSKGWRGEHGDGALMES